MVCATFAPGVAWDFYYLRKHQSYFPTPGMLLALLYIQEFYSKHYAEI